MLHMIIGLSTVKYLSELWGPCSPHLTPFSPRILLCRETSRWGTELRHQQEATEELGPGSKWDAEMKKPKEMGGRQEVRGGRGSSGKTGCAQWEPQEWKKCGLREWKELGKGTGSRNHSSQTLLMALRLSGALEKNKIKKGLFYPFSSRILDVFNNIIV